MTPFEQTWQLTKEAYANLGDDVPTGAMDKKLYKLTREEWLQSEEDALLELQSSRALPRAD